MLVLVGASLAALIGFTALAIDLGMLYDAQNEAQRAADAAALAGASAYLDYPSAFEAEAYTRDRAYQYATQNTIRGAAIDSAEVVVQPNTDRYTVYVRINHPFVPMLFGKIFRPFYSIAAAATAEAAEAGQIACMKPWAIPDEGYSPEDIGQLDTLKAADENASGVDSYFFPFVLPHDPTITQTCPQAGNQWGGFHPRGATNGGNCGITNPPGSNACWYRANICNENCATVDAGVPYDVQKGDMDGPTAQGVNAILAADPNVQFNPSTGRLERNGSEIDFSETDRVVKVALYDKATYTHPDQTAISFTGFAYWFLEFSPAGSHTYYNPDQQPPILGRFLFFAPGTGGGTQTGPFARYLRLIQ
jgi:hypothetical protein